MYDIEIKKNIPMPSTAKRGGMMKKLKNAYSQMVVGDSIDIPAEWITQVYIVAKKSGVRVSARRSKDLATYTLWRIK